MTLLIVDDEFYSVENLRAKLDWAALGFGQVLCAYSMAQAQEIFRRETIDILLCDIEMPQGSGLDLLEWVRGEGFPTVCIFLTCYAEFGYASKALHLGSSDYLLKPVDREELLAAVERAIEQVRQQEAQRTNALHAGYWNSSAVQRANQFWFRLVSERISQTRAEIAGELQLHHLPDTLLEQAFYPILLDCVPTDEVSQWEASIYEYAVKNILRELFLPGGVDGEEDLSYGAIITPNKQQHLILLASTENRGDMLARCEQSAVSCGASLPGIFRFFAGRECPIEEVAAVCAELARAARENITRRNTVFDITAGDTSADTSVAIPAERWGDLLLEQRVGDLHREVSRFLRQLSQHHHTRRRDLTHFYYDFSQVLYTQLERGGAAAHKLFDDTALVLLSETACDSIQNMEEWVATVLDAYTDHIEATREAGTVIEEVRQYIREHLSEELNRNELAAAVYLSPDYLSHLFPEKTGMPLTTYITNERIRHAKELLLQNKLSIRDIALASGFQNISYFSKQFKRITGITPQEFRKRGR